MNAPAAINVTDAQPLEKPWKRYLPAVDALRPASELKERSYRAGLMLQRDTAAACRRATTSPEAEHAFYLIEQIAGEHCLSDAPEDALYGLLLALSKMREAATEIAAVTSRDG